MRKVSSIAAALAAALLLAGCGPQPVRNAGPPPPAPPAAVPFGQLKAPALDAVDFVSDTVGYVGGQGLILKSADGGRTWMKLYTSSDNVLDVDAVNAADVWAATKDYLLRSTDGLRFSRVDLPALIGGKGIQAIDFASADRGFILADGVVWRLTGGGQPVKATPPGPADSLSFVDPNTGFAAGGHLVYKTSDGGTTWRQVYNVPVQTSGLTGTWRADIHAASAVSAWVLVTGGAQDMNQRAYVVYHTTDGVSFTPVMDEGHFPILYPSVHLASDRNLGAMPGSFAVYGDQDAFFVGWYPEQLQLTRTVDNGKTIEHFNIGQSGDPAYPDFFSPMGISFADATHGWIAGSRQGLGLLLSTTDGKNFQPVP